MILAEYLDIIPTFIGFVAQWIGPINVYCVSDVCYMVVVICSSRI